MDNMNTKNVPCGENGYSKLEMKGGRRERWDSGMVEKGRQRG